MSLLNLWEGLVFIVRASCVGRIVDVCDVVELVADSSVNGCGIPVSPDEHPACNANLCRSTGGEITYT